MHATVLRCGLPSRRDQYRVRFTTAASGWYNKSIRSESREETGHTRSGTWSGKYWPDFEPKLIGETKSSYIPFSADGPGRQDR